MELRPDGLCPVGVGVLHEGFSAPPLERPAERAEGARPVLFREGSAAVFRQPSELLGVDEASFPTGEGVSYGAGRDEARIPEGPPRPLDQHLQVRRGVGGEALRPEGVGECLLRHQLAAAAREHPDQRADAASTELARRDLLVPAAHDEAAQQPDLHTAPPAASATASEL